MPDVAQRIQSTLDRLTRKWWFYLLLLIVFFIPASAERSFDPRDAGRVIAEAMPNAVIYSDRALFPIFKLLPLVALAFLLFSQRLGRRVFHAYAALNLLAIALFQNTAATETYGRVVLVGNMVLCLIVALFWTWEAVTGRGDSAPAPIPPWKYWAVPLALLAFWFPVNTDAVPRPEFSPLLLLTNEAGLTGCMMIPVYLAALTSLHPRVNLAVLRVTGFTGLLFGIMNLLQWFVLVPTGWWMGVLHLPLFVLSLYALIMGLRADGCVKTVDLPSPPGYKFS